MILGISISEENLEKLLFEQENKKIRNYHNPK